MAKLSRPEQFYSEVLLTELTSGGAETLITVSACPTADSGYGIISPRVKTKRESVYFTVTDRPNKELTIVRGLKFSNADGTAVDKTRNASLCKSHSIGEVFEIDNGRYEMDLVDRINGYTAQDTPVNAGDLVTKAYADGLTYAGAPNGDEATKGIYESATATELNNATDLGSTGASLVATAKNLALSIYKLSLPTQTEKEALVGTSGTPSTSNKFVTDADTTTTASAGKLIRADGSGKLDESVCQTADANITALTNTGATTLHYHKNIFVLATRDLSTASGTQVIAHGLGSIPKSVRIDSRVMLYSNGNVHSESIGIYNGSSTVCVSTHSNNGSGSGSANSTSNIIVVYDESLAGAQTATISIDVTNITLTWTKSAGSPTGTCQMLITSSS